MGKKTRLENSQTESINSIERFPLAMAILNFLPRTQFMTYIVEHNKMLP